MTQGDMAMIFQVLAFAAAAVSGLYAWITGRDKATQTELKDLRDDLQSIESRVSRAESEMASLPAAGDAVALQAQADALKTAS